MIRYEEEYVLPALRAAAQHADKLPPEVARAVLLAASLVETRGYATREELAEELGETWVLARRTRDIVRRYGDNVRCYTNKGYDDAVRRALAKRADRLEREMKQKRAKTCLLCLGPLHVGLCRDQKAQVTGKAPK